jgi:hypothetical protein
VTRGSDVRAVVLPGDGVVARYPGVVCVARCPDAEPLARLLEVCAAVAGPDAGRALARRLAAWLAGADAPPDGLQFGTVATAGESVAVFLSGAVDAVVGGARLSGADAAAWLDRLVPASGGPVRLALSGAGDAGPLAALHDLREGAVPGAGVELVPAGAAAPADAPPSAPSTPRRINAQPTLVDVEAVDDRDAAPPALVKAAAPTPVPPVPAPPVPVPPVPGPPVPAPAGSSAPDVEGTGPVAPVAPAAPLRAPVRAEAILGVAPAEPPRAPLEAGDAAGTGSRSVRGAAPAGPGPGEARGHLCSRGHLNDPRSHFCVLCGIRMNERTGVLVIGSRPPLGLLVFDDGATYTVDAEYLVGRMPESDERVRSGELRSIVVEDRSGAVSRVHAEVRVDGWDVVLVDSGSRNGTYIAGPGEPAWSTLPAGQSRRLVPGTRVRLGARTFVFESPSGVR